MTHTQFTSLVADLLSNDASKVRAANQELYKQAVTEPLHDSPKLSADLALAEAASK